MCKMDAQRVVETIHMFYVGTTVVFLLNVLLEE